MSIKPSIASEIRPLLESLGGTDEVRREAAIARLAVIGARAVDRLASTFAAPDTTRATKVAILRVAEAVADARAIPMARRALADGGDVAVAACGTLRALLDSTAPGASAEALDTLIATALDRSVERRVRIAAYDALQDMPADVRERVAKALAGDSDAVIRTRLAEAPRDMAAAEALWQDAMEGRLPDAPAALREVVQARAASAPLGALQKLVDALREREANPAFASTAPEWRATRGAVHQALALRGSRIAVYDLRETVEATRAPLPSTFLTALHLVGDESCLPPIAAAHARASDDERWRGQLEAAYQAVVKREKLSRKRLPGLKTRPTSVLRRRTGTRGAKRRV